MANYIGYIYSITNEINGKSYIGKTNDLVRSTRTYGNYIWRYKERKEVSNG